MTSSPSDRFLGRVGAAPISWGICEAPGWGLQLPVDRVLGEARGLGITAMEQGALGWLPTDPAEQQAKLNEYGIDLLGGFVAMVLHDPDRSEAELARARSVAETMAQAGGRFYVTAIVADLDDWHRPAIGDEGWAEIFTNLGRLDEICDEIGLVQAVHPHVDTLLETKEEFDHFLESCSTRFCFDTGHLTIGGADVLALAEHQRDRIGLVHLKDVNGEVMARERSGELDLMAATQAGLFPSLGQGMVPVAEVVRSLEGAGYDGWYVMETDVALTDGEPPEGEGPVEGVARSLQYLRSLEPTLAPS